MFKDREFLLGKKNGFILPLSLIILLIILVVSMWAYREVIFDLWATYSQKKFSRVFYATESAAYKAVIEKIIPSSINYFPLGSYVDYDYNIPMGNDDVQVKVSIKNLGLTRNCTRSTCCQRFEVKANIEGKAVLVKIVAVKSVLDEELCSQIF